MTSYRELIDRLEDFCDAHFQVQKFGSDFDEQITNFATEDEKFPIVFVSPVSSSYGDSLNSISIEIKCLDIIQNDRANINTILSDTHQILNDIYLDINTGTDWTIDVISSSVTPLNNDLLDYAAGWVLSLDLEVETYCVDDIPD
jgi:hypothetical protein